MGPRTGDGVLAVLSLFSLLEHADNGDAERVRPAAA